MRRGDSEHLPATPDQAADPRTPAERLRELAQDPQLAPIVAGNPSAGADLLRELGSRVADAPSLSVATAIALMTRGVVGVVAEQMHDLGKLASDPVLAAVAANPNTPVEILLRLAGVFPGQFCANPAFPLLLLENPNLPAEMPIGTLRALLRYDGVPREFLEWVAAYSLSEVAELASLHVNLAGEAGADWEELARAAIWKTSAATHNELLLEMISLDAAPVWLLELLAADGDKAVRRAVARSSATPRTLLRPFRRAGASSDLAGYAQPDPTIDLALLAWLADGGLYARKLAARHPGTPAAVLERLAGDPERGVRQGVARNLGTPPRALARLAADTEQDVRQAAARNPGTPAQALERLAGDRAKDVRWAVARNRNTPADTLASLARDPHPVVRQGVARNPVAPSSVLDLLAHDLHQAVRLMAARNTYISAGALERLAADEDSEIRQAVARNPAASTHLRDRLAEDRLAVKSKTAARKKLDDKRAFGRSEAILDAQQRHDAQALEHMAMAADPSIRAIAAANPNTPLGLLKKLADDDNVRVRVAVAHNPNTPVTLLGWLADDDELVVHRAVATNLATPSGILERFAEDYTWSNVNVRRAVVRHPNVSAGTLERLAGDLAVDIRRVVLDHPRTPAHSRAQILVSSLDMCTRTSEPFYHMLALAHPTAPLDYLRARVGSPEWLERYAIARNPGAPEDILMALTSDGNRIVRAAARAALEAR
jgi:hypothetical protein